MKLSAFFLFPIMFAFLFGQVVSAKETYATQSLTQSLQKQWAEYKYASADKDQRIKLLSALFEKSQQDVEQFPDSANLHIWSGIIGATLAGEKGGLGALSLVKTAKKEFEKAIEVEPTALNGSAFTSLGSLYYQVPGWPIGFGSDTKAKEFLEKGLTINPDGVDSNFFYADFLRDQGDTDGAVKYFEKALKAPPRSDRAIADKGRRDEIHAKLIELKQANTAFNGVINH